MTDVEAMTDARVGKKPPNAFFIWRAATYEKAEKEAQTKDIKVVAKKLGQYWKALKPADKAKFEADAKKQKDKYFAFLATDAGKKAVAARREALKAKKIKKANKAVKAVSKSYKLKSQSTKMCAYYMFMADNWKKSDKGKKLYVDKVISAKVISKTDKKNDVTAGCTEVDGCPWRLTSSTTSTSYATAKGRE